MATLAVYYDPRNRLAIDHAHLPHEVSAASMTFDTPRDENELEEAAKRLLDMLIAQIKD